MARVVRVATLALVLTVASPWMHEAWGATARKSDTASAPQLPRDVVDTLSTPSRGRTLSVRKGSDPQTALDAAQPGDTVSLEAGAAFRGNFILPKKPGSGWIIVRTSAPDRDLPRPGTRVTPASSAVMPKLISPNDSPAVQTAPGAHHYRFIGVEFSAAEYVPRIGTIVAFGGRQARLADVPSHLILDRCFIHGQPGADTFRGVLLNSGAAALVDSHVSEIHVRGRDSQAVLGYNGPGPFKISNNYLEAAGENVMFGGADPAIPDLVPSDIEISGNHMAKPRSWNVGDPSYAGVPWTQKAIVELKNAQRVLIRGNLLENIAGEKGGALLLTPRNQGNSAPWSVVRDVTFEDNIVRGAAVGWKAQGLDDGHRSQQLRRVSIQNNLWLSIGRSFFYALGPIEDLAIEHNTALPVAYSAYHVEGDPPLRRFRLVKNIIGGGAQGLSFARVGDKRWLPDAVIGGNVLVGGAAKVNGGAEARPGAWFRWFLDVASAGVDDNGSLAVGSPLKAPGGDEVDPGVDLRRLEEAIRAASPGVRIGVGGR